MERQKIAYSYIRFSRPEQLKGDSLRRQKEQSQKWCDKNGYHLDDSLRLVDEGRSAFHGDHLKHKLGRFIEAVDDGRVGKGSVLIVESLDRLSRQAVGTALASFLELLGKGISIATLEPEEFFDKDSINNTVQLIVVIVILSRAYEESATKSYRLRKRWEKKRDDLANGKKLTGRCPGWLDLHDNEFHFNKHAPTVRRIVKLYLDGRGVRSISRTLNAEGVERIGRGKQKGTHWNLSTLRSILRSRALIGEFQAHLARSSQSPTDRQPIGEPIEGYFPPLISEADFYRVQSIMDSKSFEVRGTSNGTTTNLFQGLFVDARILSSMHVVDKGERASGKQIVSSAGRMGSAEYMAFPYPAVESALLTLLQTITPQDISSNKNAGELEEEADTLTGKLGNETTKLTRLQDKIDNTDDPDEIEPLLPLITNCQKRKRQIEERLEEIARELHTSLPTAEACRSLITLMQETEGDERDTNRRKFQQLAKDVIDHIDVLILVDGHWRQAYLHVILQNGNSRFIIVTTHRAKVKSMGGYLVAPDLRDPEFQFQLQSNLATMKARSVKQTEQNLDHYMMTGEAVSNAQ